MQRYHNLTPQEAYVMLQKGTEPRESGSLYHNKQIGVYACKRCDAPLYLSDDKFDSSCGWPSFDDAIVGAVQQKPDPDGRRTEILCQSCKAHLGHIFLNEGFTPKNVRHCANSLSLNFLPAFTSDGYARALFGGGCFWGVEKLMQSEPGVVSTRVGYAGGHVVLPSYAEVCTGLTGHAEVVEIIFDTSQTSYDTLARLFFEIHDPTQLNEQGPDVGTQYRSVVFYLSNEQKKTAESLKNQLEAKGYAIATQIVPAYPFYPAEDYHQHYYDKTGHKPYCHTKTPRF